VLGFKGDGDELDLRNGETLKSISAEEVAAAEVRLTRSGRSKPRPCGWEITHRAGTQ